MSLDQAAQYIARHYFSPPAGKPVVVACDAEKLVLGRALVAELEAAGNPAIVAVLEGETPALRQALARLLDDDSIALAVLASHRMWADLGLNKRLTFRQRQPSLQGRPDPLFFDAVTPLESLVRLYSVDPQDIQVFLDGLQWSLRDLADLRLSTPAGTDLVFTAREWQPWGWEMMTCPIESSVHGRIVVDAGVFFGRISQPFELTIDMGKLTATHCPDPEDPIFRQYRQWMMEAMEIHPGNAQVAEIGLGANPGAQISEVVMESEAVQGTIHVCFGDNAIYQGMGGQNATGWHGGTVILYDPRFD